ncbi:MAG: NAD-dependent epimerase/dehydratase family protein [Planctomycetota bacterium]
MIGSALVTGGGGFLGGALVDALLNRGASVASASRGDYPGLAEKGVASLRIDLADDPGPLVALLREREVDTIFHCAARPGVWGRAEAYERANVQATANVLVAARDASVERVVFTSSPSVVFDGRDHVRAGPDLPYPDRYLAHYPRTKAVAERAVLAANGPDLATVALRPHLIYGPGDPNLVPRLLERADAGRLRIVGDGMSEVSLTFVENAAAAHLAAADALDDEGATSPCAGRAFFVNDLQPVRLWEWVDEVLVGTGRPPVTRRVSPGLAVAVGSALEAAYRLARRYDGEPPMTRFVAKQLATNHTYDMQPFIAATGERYREPVSGREATARTIEWARTAHRR